MKFTSSLVKTWPLSDTKVYLFWFLFVLQGAIEDLKSILISLQVNCELDQTSYPTLDPVKQEALSLLQSSSSTSLKAIAGVEGAVSVEARPQDKDVSEERMLVTRNSSIGMNCIDNRYPSSPFSDHWESFYLCVSIKLENISHGNLIFNSKKRCTIFNNSIHLLIYNRRSGDYFILRSVPEGFDKIYQKEIHHLKGRKSCGYSALQCLWSLISQADQFIWRFFISLGKSYVAFSEFLLRFAFFDLYVEDE